MRFDELRELPYSSTNMDSSGRIGNANASEETLQTFICLILALYTSNHQTPSVKTVLILFAAEVGVFQVDDTLVAGTVRDVQLSLSAELCNRFDSLDPNEPKCKEADEIRHCNMCP